ncbi:MAG: hypothetical protein C0518_08195 [Opitutus sp.]|nr:hypothetical protein [Opitutus sp.]
MKCAHLIAAAIALLPSLLLHGTVPEFTWTGAASSNSTESANNWQNGIAPAFDGSELLRFGASRKNFISVPSISAFGLRITDHYHFDGESTLTLGASGLEFTPTNTSTHAVFEQYVNVALAAAQTWTVTNGSVEVRGQITGSGDLTKAGQGRLMLFDGNSGYSGNLTLANGSLEIVADPEYSTTTALGTGTLTFGAPTGLKPPTLIARFEGGDNEDSSIQVDNAIVVNGVLATKNDAELNLTGDVTLNTSSTFTTSGDWLIIDGAINEASEGKKLTIDAAGVIVLTGSSGWTGGTQINKGILVFAGDDDNTPGTTDGITVGSLGYVGITVGQNVGGFLGELNKSSSGTLGFDSDPEAPQSTFDGTVELPLALDLTGFNSSFRLGSATKAILGQNVVITPQGSDYRFGGGGGILTVASRLTGSYGLVLDSPDQLPLTVRLLNQTNNFTGNISVTNSGLVFTDNQGAGSTALPTGTFSMNAASYIGHEDPHVTPATFFAKFAQNTPGIIGFDLAPNQLSTRVIDLTGVQIGNSAETDFTNAYLGTSSFLFNTELGEITGPGVRFTGTIEPNSDLIHRFAAYKGGALEVAGTLTGSALIVGQPDSLGAFGDRMRELYSTVLISGNNAGGLTGGTTFYGGQLMIGQHANDGIVGTDHTHALGEGTLTIAPITFTIEGDDDSPAPLLTAAQSGIIVPNAIALNTEVDVGGDHNFTLAGNISGSGELYVGEESDGAFTLTLSGNNTFSGGVYVTRDSVVNAASNTALGTGPLAFGSFSSSSPVVNFSSNAPVVGELSSQNHALLELTQDNTILTVNQPTNNEYGDTFRGRISGGGEGQNARLVKTGPGTLRLEGNSNDNGNDYGFYAYGFDATTPAGTVPVLMEVRGGTLAIGPDFYIEDSSSRLWVNGGTLAISNEADVYNPILVTSGNIAGNGNLGNVSVGSGAKVMPGFDDANGRIGSLTIDHLTLAGGAIFEWDIASALSGNSNSRDSLTIGTASTLEITATDTRDSTKLVIRPVTLSSTGVNGILSDLAAGEVYSWTLIEYLGIEGIAQAIDPTNVRLDLSAWQANVAGTFKLEFTSLSGSGQLLLSFTAVPEPSTYALLALGLGFIGVTCWCRRRV